MAILLSTDGDADAAVDAVFSSLCTVRPCDRLTVVGNAGRSIRQLVCSRMPDDLSGAVHDSST